MFYDNEVWWMVGILVYNWWHLIFINSWLASKMRPLLIWWLEKKEHQKTLRMAKRKLGFLRIQFHALIGQLLNLKKGYEGLSIHPHTICYVEVVDKWKYELNVTMCVICNCPFPLFDIIVCSCQHLYHPWCVAIWFKIINSCRNEECISVLHLEWLKSFGFASLIAELKKKVAYMDCEMVWRMAIAQRKVVVQSIHPAIDNVPFSIHLMFVFYSLPLQPFIYY